MFSYQRYVLLTVNQLTPTLRPRALLEEAIAQKLVASPIEMLHLGELLYFFKLLQVGRECLSFFDYANKNKMKAAGSVFLQPPISP